MDTETDGMDKPRFHSLLPLSHFTTSKTYTSASCILELRLFPRDSESTTESAPRKPEKLRILVFLIAQQSLTSNASNPSTTSASYKAYAIQPLCPHASHPLQLGDIEDIFTNPRIICPAHHFDFALDGGESTRSECKARTCEARIGNTDGVLAVEIGFGREVDKVELVRAGKVIYN